MGCCFSKESKSSRQYPITVCQFRSLVFIPLCLASATTTAYFEGCYLILIRQSVFILILWLDVNVGCVVSKLIRSSTVCLLLD